MPLEELKQKLRKFQKERDWKQFHNPKDLALSLSLESAEVLELFQWKSSLEEIEEVTVKKKQQLSEEIADVLLYLIMLADESNVDLEKAAKEKLKKNEKKYPVSKAKGSSKKYDEL